MISTFWEPASDGVLAGARKNGERGEAIVFVHGVGSTAAIWDYQLEAFGETHRAYAVELRGNGIAKPEPAPARITRRGFANDVLAIVDVQEHERFHFVGCSLGGVVGFELWQIAPARIASFTIVGSFAKYPDAERYVEGVVRAVREAGNMQQFALERAAKLGLPPNRLAETVAQMACKDVESYVASTHATWIGDYRATLPTIDVPTLVLVGARDTIAPLPLAQEIAAGIRGARLEVMGNAGHVANADDPQAFNALLRSFLSGLRS